MASNDRAASAAPAAPAAIETATNGAAASTAATPPPPKVEHFTPAERAAPREGGARRGAARAPRRVGAGADRPDPVELLEDQAASRGAELVPIRYGRMLVSPFTFYRGAAALMAADLAAGPGTGLHAQLCGDAHLSNFGVFAAPDRRLVFEPQRLRRDAARARSSGTSSGWSASFAVAGRDRGFDRAADRRADRRRSAERLPARRCASSPACATSTSGTRASTSTRSPPSPASEARPQELKRVRDERGQGARQGQHAGVRPS